MTATATLVFERTSHRRYSARPIALLVDGITKGEVGRGERLEVEVSTGTHDAVGELDDYQSQPLRFKVAPGEVVHVRCWPNPKARFSVPWWSIVSVKAQAKYQRFKDPTGLGLVILERVEPAGDS
jgi:hypothetical protein